MSRAAGSRSIVLLNDHEDTADILVQDLRQEGFHVEGYTLPESALEHLLSPPEPCLVIVDH